MVATDSCLLESAGSHEGETGDPCDEERAEQAWRLRWGGMLACAAAKAVASSLFDLLHHHRGDGKAPLTHEVDGDPRYAGLCR